MPEDLDAIDLRILEHLQQDASLSTAELADKIGLSQSPCWRRVQRLRDEGYIKRQVAILDRAKLGLDMQIFAQIKVARLDDDERVAFERAINNTPEIVECYSVFGELDLMIKVVAPDVRWYQEFIFSTLMKLPGVQDVRSVMTLAEMKYTTAMPLPRKGGGGTASIAKSRVKR
ncbi:MAG: AsnC family transcriptional regulator [Rhodospirillales bacterium]|nr:AsnC family transcriptional regulator [Rhodospirillales bacterium]